MLDHTPVEATEHAFTPREYARLEIYRRAVRAGFYNEALSTAERPGVAARQEHRHGLEPDLLSSFI